MKKSINTYVRYGSNGIFLIKDIAKRTSNEGVSEDWYVLLSDNDGVMTSVMTPVDNNIIRPILSKNEVKKLIKAMPDIPSVWIEDKHRRHESFKSLLDSGNIYKLVQVINSIERAKRKKEEDNKTISEKDQEILTFAQDLLYMEVALSFDIKKDEVQEFILQGVSS